MRRLEHVEQYGYRADPNVPLFPDDKPIIVFDGKCVLCSRRARFVMRRDRDKRFTCFVPESGDADRFIG